MKIVTWNVNGIRAALKKGALDWVWKHSPDVLCLQEVKARPDQLTEDQMKLLPYSYSWNPAEKAGYSGVATFYKEQPLDIQMGMGESRFDIEGRVISTLHPGFRLFNIYFPNGQRGHDRVEYKLDFYAHLLKVCGDLHKMGESIVITGDFNTAHMPIDLKNPKSNEKTSGFMPEERAWVQKFLDHGFVDIYRKLYPEERGVGWRIDYFLVSENLASRVKDVVIHDKILGSDHCPVELMIE